MSYLRKGSFPGMAGFLDDLASAIARMEGSCSAPGVCVNNNPGNLRAGPGATGVDSRGIAIFPDFATGQAALVRQENLNINRGLTLSEFFGGKAGVYPGYAPAADSNNPSAYTGNVASWLGIPADVPLSDVMGGSYVSSGVESAPAGASVAAADLQDAGLSLDSLLPAGTEGLSGAAWAGLALMGAGLVWAVVS